MSEDEGSAAQETPEEAHSTAGAAASERDAATVAPDALDASSEAAGTPDAAAHGEDDGAAPGEPMATGLRVEPDALSALQERVAQLEREVEAERTAGTDYMRKWQQAQADLANFRRRAQQEAEQFAALAAAQAMELVLPALDSFERAFNTLPESLHRLTWIEGIALVDGQLRRALERHGVTPFEPKPGEALDPARHQAVAQTETNAHPEGAIVDVVQRGYELRGRTLRPALVRVARAPASSAASTADTPTSESGAASNSGKPSFTESGPAPPDNTP